MRSFLSVLLILGLFIIWAGTNANAVYAQNFKFELGTTSPITVGSSFPVKVLINTAGSKVTVGDAIVIFDNNLLSISSAQNGGFFSSFTNSPIGGSANKYILAGFEASDLYAKSTTTDALFATMNLSAKAGGTTSLAFDCTQSNTTGTDSNIWDVSQKDIINCSQTLPLTINIGGPGPTGTPSATLTPAPTSSPSATPTRKPTAAPIPTNVPKPTMPRSGTAEVTVGLLGIGALLTVVGLLIIL